MQRDVMCDDTDKNCRRSNINADFPQRAKVMPRLISKLLSRLLAVGDSSAKGKILSDQGQSLLALLAGLPPVVPTASQPIRHS
jgi:hypothetical protein